MTIILIASILLISFVWATKKPIHLSLPIIIIIALAVRLLVTLFVSSVANHDITFRHAIADLIVKKDNIYFMPEDGKGEFSTAYFPLSHYLDAAVLSLEKYGVPFAPTSKIVFSLFDIGIVLILAKLKSDKNKTALLYALNPVSIMVTNIHGQFDVSSVFFILLSIYLLNKHEMLSHGAFALAVLSKTWPIFFVIPFLKRSSKPFLLLFIIFLAVAFITVTYSIIFNVSLNEISLGMRKYVGLLGEWGYTSILYFTKRDFELSTLRSWNVFSLVFLVCFAILSFLLKSKNIIEEILTLIIVYFIVVPGFSTQWTIWIMPFLIILKPRFWTVFVVSITIWLSLFQTSWITTNTNVTLLVLAAAKVAGIYAWFITIIMLFFWIRRKESQ